MIKLYEQKSLINEIVTKDEVNLRFILVKLSSCIISLEIDEIRLRNVVLY